MKFAKASLLSFFVVAGAIGCSNEAPSQDDEGNVATEAVYGIRHDLVTETTSDCTYTSTSSDQIPGKVVFVVSEFLGKKGTTREGLADFAIDASASFPYANQSGVVFSKLTPLSGSFAGGNISRGAVDAFTNTTRPKALASALRGAINVSGAPTGFLGNLSFESLTASPTTDTGISAFRANVVAAAGGVTLEKREIVSGTCKVSVRKVSPRP